MPNTASAKEIGKAWRLKMRTTHPDKHEGAAALELSKALNSAKDEALLILRQQPRDNDALRRKRQQEQEDTRQKVQREEEQARSNLFKQKMFEDIKKRAAEIRRKEEEEVAARQAAVVIKAAAEKAKQAAADARKAAAAAKKAAAGAKQDEKDELYRQRMRLEQVEREKREDAAYRLEKEKAAQGGQQKRKLEKECVVEFIAHARGQEPGLERLKRVCHSILRHYDIDGGRLDTLLGDAGLYKELRSGEIRKYANVWGHDDKRL